MAFESLSERLQGSIKKIRGQSHLTEQNMDEMLREIRLALLEADVNFKVVKTFIQNVKEKALGQDVLSSLTPGQMVVKIVHEELVELLGTTVSEVNFDKKPTIIMMVGLQGAGKTTTTGKIANLIRKKYSKKPLLVAADIYRPAAIEQLETIGKQLDVPVFSKGTDIKPEQIVTEALEFAKENNNDVIFIDTAGRLHIDEVLMDELLNIKNIAHPDEILLVVDALTGQDIVNVASSFNEKLSITGAVLTKLDGDARGGGALSIRHITNVPIKFIGTGEKLDALDLFYPDRMADRILGMGDVMSLIEKAQDVIDEKSTKKSLDRLTSGQFGLDDMLEQLKQVQKLGPISGILKMIPGMGANMPKINDEDTNKEMKRTEAIINSMTKAERRDPSILNAKRKQRIAAGCGMQVADINRLLKRFEQSKMLMENMTRINPMTGMISGKPKKSNFVQPNRKKERHKKKKKK
ncbi:MAG: signal recognition particle protein [Erysipelotrichaceae bacterium]|nr:signal recognition particle protein [Erysipelotrichaceae bacterium]